MDTAPCVRAHKQHQAVAWTSGDARIHTMPVSGLAAVRIGRRVEVRRRPCERRRSNVVRRERIAAAAWQTWIERRDYRVRLIVARADAGVVDHEKVVEPSPVVSDFG